MTEVPKGKYRLLGNGHYEARCGSPNCDRRVKVQCGASGCLYAPVRLRQQGWGIRGRTSGAKWFCPDHQRLEHSV